MEIVSTLTVTRGSRIDDGQGQNSLGVYEAFDPQIGMRLALKEISKKGLNVDSFFSEAQRMFESEHPNVVPIRTASQTEHTILLLMPLYKNGSLKSRITNKPLSICDAVRIGRDILGGVGAIHAGGSVHYDIKPSNVLFADNGVAKVADFGQARELGPDGFALMPHRMYAPLTPPEAFTRNRVGSRLSDIFQVGVTLYRAVNGEAYFDEQLLALSDQKSLRNAIISGKLPHRNKFLPHVPDRLRRVLRRAMSTDESKRYHSAQEFATALARTLPALDWQMEFQSGGTIKWETERLNKPNLCVLSKPSTKTIDIELYTVNGTGLRVAKKGFWKQRQTKREAENYLTLLFAALE